MRDVVSEFIIETEDSGLIGLYVFEVAVLNEDLALSQSIHQSHWVTILEPFESRLADGYWILIILEYDVHRRLLQGHSYVSDQSTVLKPN